MQFLGHFVFQFLLICFFICLNNLNYRKSRHFSIALKVIINFYNQTILTFFRDFRGLRLTIVDFSKYYRKKYSKAHTKLDSWLSKNNIKKIYIQEGLIHTRMLKDPVYMNEFIVNVSPSTPLFRYLYVYIQIGLQ